MTLAIAHTEGKKQILDVIRERKPPFSPEAVTEEFAKLIRSYRCTTSTEIATAVSGRASSSASMASTMSHRKARSPKSMWTCFRSSTVAPLTCLSMSGF